MPEVLNPRQRQILDYLRDHGSKHPYPPTVREIGHAVGLSSSSTVHMHLNALERKGFIHRDPTKSRTVEVVGAAIHHASAYRLPLIGNVAAGTPLLAEANIEDHIAVAPEIARDENSFCLTVRGDSMINAGIYEGDIVVVRPGQGTPNNGAIVVARIENEQTGESEVTVKKFYRESSRVRLQPENDAYEPIYASSPTIEGTVVAVIRILS
jgi:repressor LexA